MAEALEQNARTEIDRLFEAAGWVSLPFAMTRIRIWRSAVFPFYNLIVKPFGLVCAGIGAGVRKLAYEQP